MASLASFPHSSCFSGDRSGDRSFGDHTSNRSGSRTSDRTSSRSIIDRYSSRSIIDRYSSRTISDHTGDRTSSDCSIHRSSSDRFALANMPQSGTMPRVRSPWLVRLLAPMRGRSCQWSSQRRVMDAPPLQHRHLSAR